MKCRYLLPLWLLGLLGCMPVFAQPFTLSAPVDSAGPGDTLCVSVRADQFTDLVSLQFTVSWDSSVLQFVNTANFNPTLGLNVTNFGTNAASQGAVTFSWDDVLVTGVSVPNGSALFDLCFVLVGSLGDSSSLCFTDVPTSREAVRLVGGSFNVIPVSSNCGEIRIVDICANFSLTGSSTPEVCGQGNGTLLGQASGGLPPYTYRLGFNGMPQISGSFTGLTGGSYTIYATDGNGCVDSLGLQVSDVPPPTLLVDTLIDDACGQGIGQVQMQASGGTPGYQYSLDGGIPQAMGVFAGLPAGTYLMAVADANGCADTLSVSLSDLPGPSLVATDSTRSTCASANGGLTVQASGGQPPYTYTLDSITQTSPIFTGLLSGSYVVVVADANGCTDSVQVGVGAVPPVQLVAAGVVQPTCGQANGSLTLSTTQGVSPFAYSLDGSSPGPTSTYGSLSAGTYQAAVVDSVGCVDSLTVVLTDQPGPGLSLASSSDATCGLPNGTATITVSGGNGPVGVSWNTTPPQTTPTATGLAVGSYVVTALDSSGCEATDTVQIDSVTPPLLTLLSTEADSCGAGDGSATVVASLGSTPYQYLWNTSPPQTGATASSLPGGEHLVVLTDADGCTASLTVSIDSVPAPLVSVDPFGARCADALPLELSSGAPSGGTYSGPGVSNGRFDPAVVGPGTYPISYTFTAANGCSSTAVDSVVVHALPDQPVITRTNTILSTDLAASYQWFLDGVAIPNAINQVEALVGNGSYTVQITDSNGCQATSEPFLVTHRADASLAGVRLAPNPNQGVAQLWLPGPGQATLYNLLGQPLGHWSFVEAGSQALSLTALVAGVYSLRVQLADGRRQTLRVIRQD